MTIGMPKGLKPGHTSTIRRIEGGMLSYHADMTINTNPFELGMDKFIDLNSDFNFIGKEALIKINREGIKRKQVGLFLNTDPMEGPNTRFWDVMLNDKKIGGILVETETNNRNIKTIIGIGINLNISKKESWWGDLSKFALESKRNELINLILTEFLNIFDNSYDNWLDDWKKSCMHINKEIEIFDGEHLQKKAIFKDIDAQGNAIIESKEGEEVIATGQISIKGVY